MRYVLDSSVAVKWVLEEEHSDRARQLRDEARKAMHQLLAPDVFPVELGHALTRAERQGRIAAPDGWASWLGVMADSPRLHASLPLMPRAYALSSKMRIGELVDGSHTLSLCAWFPIFFVNSNDRVWCQLPSQLSLSLGSGCDQ